MSKTTLEMAQIMQGYDAGKKLLYREKSWRCMKPFPGSWTPFWDWTKYDYELAKEKKIVELDESDIEGFSWMRLAGSPSFISRAILVIEGSGIYVAARKKIDYYSFKELKDHGYHMSIDCKKWVPCSKEIEVD